jgi:hypothetical protein
MDLIDRESSEVTPIESFEMWCLCVYTCVRIMDLSFDAAKHSS